MGVRCKLFDWNMPYINFIIFEDAEFESDIIFHIHSIVIMDEMSLRTEGKESANVSIGTYYRRSFSIFLGVLNPNLTLFFKFYPLWGLE